MQKLFLEVVNMSITASIVLAVVLVLRLLLVRAPRRFSYLLWGIVLFRLLCPVSLPSPFSALDFTEGRATGQGGMEYFSPGDQEEITASVSLISAGSGEDPAWDGIHATVGFGQRMLPVLALVWLAGIAGMAACSILSVARLHRRVGCSLLLRDNIYLADHISTPFVLGLVRLVERILVYENNRIEIVFQYQTQFEQARALAVCAMDGDGLREAV